MIGRKKRGTSTYRVVHVPGVAYFRAGTPSLFTLQGFTRRVFTIPEASVVAA